MSSSNIFSDATWEDESHFAMRITELGDGTEELTNLTREQWPLNMVGNFIYKMRVLVVLCVSLVL